MNNIITLPANAPEMLLGYAGQLFTDLWLVVALMIGIPLGFYIIRRVIGLFKAK